MAKPVKQATTTIFQTLKKYVKAPWEFTGPCASPEYKLAVPDALDYRPYCPASEPQKAIIPTSDPETVYDIKYYVRDQRRNRSPVKTKVLKKDDVVRMMSEAKFEPPRVYLADTVEEDYSAQGGGYQK